jgi:hypothetical protein
MKAYEVIHEREGGTVYLKAHRTTVNLKKQTTTLKKSEEECHQRINTTTIVTATRKAS